MLDKKSILFCLIMLSSMNVFGNTRFLSKIESSKFLSEEDHFTKELKVLDFKSRSGGTISSREEFSKFLSEQSLEWALEEQLKVKAITGMVISKLVSFGLDEYLPEEILLIKTTGKEEFYAAYTRRNAIVLSAYSLAGPKSKLLEIYSHEFFHILSRNSDDFRDIQFRKFGYEQLKYEVKIPEEFLDFTIKNPDSRGGFYYSLNGSLNGVNVMLVPFIYAKASNFDRFKLSKLEAKFIVLDSSERYIGTVSPSEPNLIYDSTSFNPSKLTLEEHAASKFPEFLINQRPYITRSTRNE